ncbi:MAG: hypothetical protein KGR26_16455, partial [Cyanobacteria bacterium REEB65]|nr:hypothetical protein [Cyanobacteria bacterium REEB65]
MGTDVDGAAQKVGLAMEGNSRILKQLGISVKAGTDPMIILNDVLAKAEQFHNAAAAAAGTDAGQMAAVRTKADEANQALSEVLLPTVIKIENAFIDAENAVTNFLNALNIQGDTVSRLEKLNLPTTRHMSNVFGQGSDVTYNLGPSIARMYAGGSSVDDIVKYMQQEHASAKEIQQAMAAIGQGALADMGSNALTQGAHAGATGGTAANTTPQNASAASAAVSAAAKAAREQAHGYMAAVASVLGNMDTHDFEDKIAFVGNAISTAMQEHILPKADLVALQAREDRYKAEFATFTQEVQDAQDRLHKQMSKFSDDGTIQGKNLGESAQSMFGDYF